MKITSLIFILSLAALGCQQQDTFVSHPPARDGVFIHVTHGPDNPHRVTMALKMAELMSDTQDVLMYFDIKGIQVVLKDSPDIEHKAFESSHEQIEKLLKNKVTILACPGCLKAQDKTPADLRDGIKVASKEAFFGFTKGRILTLDY